MLPLKLRRNDLYNKFAAKYMLPFDTNQITKTVHGKSSQIEFFQESVDDYERRVVNSKYYKVLDQIAFIDWMTRNLKAGQRVLDLGCGTGRQDIPLAKNNIRTIGIDISEDMLILAKEKIDSLGLNTYIDLVVGDAENPPVKNNSFDACFFYGTLHHFPNKETAIASASKKIVNNGLFYSLDPHKSPVRFIFDIFMKLWKLYDEEASDNPLLTEKQLKQWLEHAEITGVTKLSTFLPPHLFHLLPHNTGIRLLKTTDSILNRIPFVRNLGGVIIAEGIKEV
jgi:ubiquinone/menaquinone biosynthesis C-methylase UbiE